MTGRAIAATVTLLLFAAGCTTTTAHRLVVIDNPLRDQALACEASCRQAATWSSDCSRSGGRPCQGTGVDPGKYATCLDGCPGARATDGGSCPTPDPGAFCVETSKANAGGIIGGVLAGVAVTLLVLVVIVLGEIASAPILIL